MYMQDTIAAIATSPGLGGIAVIRVSGENAFLIVDKIFKMKKGKRLKEVSSHTIHYGHIYDVDSQTIVDEVLVSVMKAPNTYTRENIVEINCHGGTISSQNTLQEVLKAGARLADEGEFTKRAFLKGRIDLIQAEAVIDIINAKTNVKSKTAVKQLEGNLSKRIYKVRESLLRLTAHLQAAVDFPEEDIEEITECQLKETIKKIEDDIDKILKTADVGKIIRDGLETVIVGKPNVGKSSLLNALLKDSRAIVTEVPGTTRDVIEEYINIKGIPIKIMDTAGIRETTDIVEKIGVEKSKALIERAELVIFIFDTSEALTEEDVNIKKLVEGKKVIILLNKSDLPSKIDDELLESMFNNKDIIKVSVKEGQGLSQLEDRIQELFVSGDIHLDQDIIVTNVRHKNALIKARKNLDQCIESLSIGMPIDMMSIDLKEAIESLGEIIGLTVSEEIVNQIFSQFCLGK